MVFKIKTFLLKFDFIGFIPQFRILDESRYKSLFSTILSFLIILFSINFVLYSFIDFINQIPEVEYYKNNDYETNKTIVLSDSLLMFKPFFNCSSDPLKLPDITVSLTIPLEQKYLDAKFEPCELGKNINLKYKDLIKKFDSIENYQSSEYFCINYNSTNISNFTLYSHPLLPFEGENSLQIIISTDCQNYTLTLKLITENDIIDHNNKVNPIIPYYKTNEYFINYPRRKNLNYYYQYIKHELDDGFIFSNKKIINGIGEAGINELDTSKGNNKILSITFKINSANYDYYLNKFQKFQSFLLKI